MCQLRNICSTFKRGLLCIHSNSFGWKNHVKIFKKGLFVNEILKFQFLMHMTAILFILKVFFFSTSRKLFLFLT